MTLTDAGRSYVEACKRIIEQVEDAERTATGEYSTPKGHLTITAPVVFGRLHLLPVALEFLTAYPDIDLRLVLSDRVLNLLEDNIDLAVRHRHPAGQQPDRDPYRLNPPGRACASPAYLAARGRPDRPDDVSGHDCIAFESLASPRAWTFTIGKVRASRADPCATRGHHGGGRDRRGRRGSRDDARAVVHDRGRATGR